jgi:hypothetical protein
MLNLGQVIRSHLTQVQHSHIHSFNVFNRLQHNGMFSFFLFSFLTDTLCQLPQRLKESVDTAPCPRVCNLLLAPPLNLPVSCNFFFFFLTNGLFAYCSLPPPLAVSMPPPLGIDSLSPVSMPLPSCHVDPPPPHVMLTPPFPRITSTPPPLMPC